MKNNSGFFSALRVLVIAAIIISSAFSTTYAEDYFQRYHNYVMIQSFGWGSQAGQPGKWYDLIASKAGELGKAGFNLVWFPPASRSVSREGYLPGDYYDLGSAGNPTHYGTKEQLAGCIDKLHKNNIMAIADIVINHRCGGKQDGDGFWNVYEFPSGKAAWNAKMVCGDDNQFHGQGNNDSGEGYGAAPDIDHDNQTVQNDIVEWMNWMKSVGFDGWRYDYVKGYAPRFNLKYDEATKPKFSVGELWTSMSYKGMKMAGEAPQYNQDGHRQQLCNWLDKAGNYTTAFDFTTKGILQYAVYGEYGRLRDAQGKAPGLIGWWPARSVTFIDNHDTGSSQQHWPFANDKVMVGYAYILTHPGIPCVFWEHYYEWDLKDQINKLISIRKQYGIGSDSKLEILAAENGLYAAYVGKTSGSLAVKLGTRDWAPPAEQGYVLLVSGKEYAVWGRKNK